MWILRGNNGTPIYIKSNQVFTVGRKNANLVLPDYSVSRKHAEITVTPSNDINQIKSNTEPLWKCVVKDTGSKYGSFIMQGTNEKLRISKEGYVLQHMDTIRFGLEGSIYTVTYVPIITATSTLDPAEKKELDEILNQIDGNITKGFDTICTHMTISTPRLSEKLTCSIILGIPIVLIGYWKALLKAVGANEELPDSEDFTKIIQQDLQLFGNISVLPDPRRKTIFRDKTFIHFDSNQYQVHRRMIALAGGTSIFYKHQQNNDVCADDTIVVQLVESNTTQATGTGDSFYQETCEKLGKCHRRTIPSGEIALAIIHCSIEKYCNPKYDHAGMFKRSSNKIAEKSTVLALDTQDVEYSMARLNTNDFRAASNDKRLSNIPETITSDVHIGETAEESSRIEPRFDKTVKNKSDKYLTAIPSGSKENPVFSDCQSQFDDASIKVASLNYEGYRDQEMHGIEEHNEKSLKRHREENCDNFDPMKKKVCVAVDDVPDNRQENESRVQQNLSEKRTENSSGNSLAQKIGDVDTSKSVMASGSRSLFNVRGSEVNEFSQKRKAINLESDIPPEVTKSPLKRSKVTESPKKSRKLPKIPEAGQTTLMKFLSPKKNENSKTSNSDTRNSWTKKNYSDITKCSEKSIDLERSSQSILRIDNLSDVTILAEPKFGKSFRKTYTINPSRIKLVDSEEELKIKDKKNYSKQHELSDERANASRKPLSSNKIKMYR